MKNNRYPVLMAVLAGMAVFCSACAEFGEYCDRLADTLNELPDRVAGPQNSQTPADSETDNTTSPTQVASTSVPVQPTLVPLLPWKDPRAEEKWAMVIKRSSRVFPDPRIEGVDSEEAEGMLEDFGTHYMPNAYAQYREKREKANELAEQMLKNFPEGEASDTTGGELFRKAGMQLVGAVAQMFRRHDELCYFLLLHQAGVFPETVLAKFDARPISLGFEFKADFWPEEDVPVSPRALSAEDAQFAAQHVPETWAACQKLDSLFRDGTDKYDEVRETAMKIDAVFARWNLRSLKMRLMEIKNKQEQMRADIHTWQVSHAMGGMSGTEMAETDREAAADLQAFLKGMSLSHYFLTHPVDADFILPVGDAMQMVWCPPGTFIMGNQQNQTREEVDEKRHRVTLTKGFWMAKYEVTQKQWKDVMQDLPEPEYRNYQRYRNREDWAFFPVQWVTWDDCMEFCRKTGLALPTEAQWEYACRAGNQEFDADGEISDCAWDASEWGAQPVGQLQPNDWELHDILGNVPEWCADWYGDYPRSPVKDPTGPASGRERIIRGWVPSDFLEDYAAHRYSQDPEDCDAPDTGAHRVGMGFRPVFCPD